MFQSLLICLFFLRILVLAATIVHSRSLFYRSSLHSLHKGIIINLYQFDSSVLGFFYSLLLPSFILPFPLSSVSPQHIIFNLRPCATFPLRLLVYSLLPFIPGLHSPVPFRSISPQHIIGQQHVVK